MASDILIVDDEADIRELISGILEDEGHGTRLAKDSDETLAAVEERRPSLVILDIWLEGSKLDGLELLDRIKRAHPDLAVVIISGHGNIETAVAAIKRGAYDYIEKPFKADRLVLIVARGHGTRSRGARIVWHRGGRRLRPAQGRRARRSAYGLALYRRGQRHAARDARQDPARARGATLPAVGR